MATTAVVAGTAGAVRHHQEQKYANQAAEQQYQAEQQYAAQAPAAPQYAPPPAPAQDDLTAQLTQLATLHSQGILTDEEFEAKKKQILGI
jgi:hypothetical protein